MTHKLIFQKTDQWLDGEIMGYTRPGHRKVNLYDWKHADWVTGMVVE